MNIDDMKTRLASLVAKNTENGASESEALAAIALATKLAVKYGVSLDDLASDDVETPAGRAVGTGSDRAGLHEVDRHLAVVIARYCDCAVLHVDGDQIEFFGFASDVELALFTRDVLKRAMVIGYHVFTAFHDGSFKGARQEWHSAFAARVRERLEAVTRERVKVPTANALVVQKTEIVSSAFAKKYPRVQNSRARHSNANNPAARAAGRTAGGAVDMGRGMAGKGNAGLLT